jgi:hypothetical protein
MKGGVMRRVTNWILRKESFGDMMDSRRYHQCIEIVFRDKKGVHRHKLSIGGSDKIDVYRENGETFVLSRNPQLGYVGMEIFAGNERTGDLFLQPHEVEEVVGSDRLQPHTIIRRLMPFV